MSGVDSDGDSRAFPFALDGMEVMPVVDEVVVRTHFVHGGHWAKGGAFILSYLAPDTTAIVGVAEISSLVLAAAAPRSVREIHHS